MHTDGNVRHAQAGATCNVDDTEPSVHPKGGHVVNSTQVQRWPLQTRRITHT